ncbi:MAG: DHH family phosphoesterase [bacterium]|nr:DHH family phosphoesterase [bacterium]
MNTGLTTDRVNKLKKVIVEASRGFAIIITQVDPDAIGSALGLAYLIKQIRGRNDVVIYYCGPVSHKQNQVAMTRYGLYDVFQPIKNWKPEESRHVVLADSSKVADARLGIELKDPPIAVIDHHRDKDVVETDESFVWVEDVGAASTMVTELFSALGVDFASLEPVIPMMLALGIRTDTDNLLRGGKRDRLAQTLVENVVNEREFRQLFNYPLPPSYYRNLKRSLEQVTQNSARLVTNIGIVSADMSDDISTFADLMIRWDGVSLVVVWCILEKEKRVRVSARNADSSRDLGSFLRERFGPSCGAKVTEDGDGIGGGSLTLDFGFWFNSETRAETEALVGKFIASAVFRD